MEREVTTAEIPTPHFTFLTSPLSLAFPKQPKYENEDQDR